ncbi:hypothetical protein SAMN05216276_1001395 [Streptosporangium subroseum]|uniref:Metallo-beta-lactamase superfamily protein n=1 Tax=Streptosporangium subroseum TaxID=106412 RepID=A0A239AHI4_9ACTN|nr:hypothetical protein [Streptosporangium subroseum]SNR94841.1 hypothetical protein SAMN05216276_1001395 [Streptosporangium subroseum]
MKLHVLDCGAMSCDLTWLLFKPGRTIRPRSERDKPVEWYSCATHAVLVETDEGTLLWDTGCPRDGETRWVPTGLQEFFPYDQVSEERYLDAQLGVGDRQRSERLVRLRGEDPFDRGAVRGQCDLRPRRGAAALHAYGSHGLLPVNGFQPVREK